MQTHRHRFRVKFLLSNKRRFAYIALVIVLLIPLFWAIGNAASVNKQGASGTQYSVSLYDTQKNLIASDSSILEFTSSRSIVSMFNQITSNMKRISSNSVNLSTFKRPLSAEISINNLTHYYTFYFSTRGNSYCTDENNQLYSIAFEDASIFLNSAYAECVYPSSTPPSIMTASGARIAPQKTNWYYKNTAGAYIKSSPATTAEELSYTMSGKIDLTFENNAVPDSLKIQIWQNDEIILNGNYDELEDIVINIGSKLKVSMMAVWNNTSNSEFHGYANYTFWVDIVDYADFSVTQTSINQNSFVILSGSNIADTSKIKFSADESNPSEYPFKPIFQQYGTNVHCLLPFTDELTPGTYNFNVSYSVFSKNISIELLPQGNMKNHNSHVSSEIISKALDEKAINELYNTIAIVPKTFSENTYLNHNFISPAIYGYACEYEYNTVITSAEGDCELASLGNRYYSNANQSSVVALNSGKVIFTGSCELLGKFVVIEHGLGLKTWYCNLSNINVMVGDYVSLGTQIGRSGTHYTSTRDGFLLLCSYNNIFLNTNSCFDEEFKLK